MALERTPAAMAPLPSGSGGLYYVLAAVGIFTLLVGATVRTRRPFFKSKPGTILWVSTLALAVLTPLVPYLPFVAALGFVPIPLTVVGTLIVITVAYVAAAELTKYWFYRATPAT